MRYVSASQITTYLDCPRKWYFQNILGLRQPPTPALATGSAYHKEIEDYILEGAAPTFASIKTGLRGPLSEIIETLKFDVAVEKSLEETGVRLADVPIKGFVDLSGFCEGGMLHVVDHKTTGDIKRALSAYDLATNAQLLLYAHALGVHYGYMGPVKLVHVYLGTKSNDCLAVSTVVDFEAIEAAVLRLSEIVESMKRDAAKELHNIYPQKTACSKYGGCHLLSRCMPVVYQAEGALSVFSNGEKNMIKPERTKKSVDLYAAVLLFERSWQESGDAGCDDYWAGVDRLAGEHGEELIESLRDRAFEELKNAAASPEVETEIEDFGIAPPDAFDFVPPRSGDDVLVEDLGFGTRTKNALIAAGFETLGDLKAYDATKFQDVDSVGKKGLAEIFEAIGFISEAAPVEPAPVEPAPVEPAPVEPAPVEAVQAQKKQTILLIGALPLRGCDDVVLFEDVVAGIARDIEKQLGRAYYTLGNFFEARDLAAGRLHELAESLIVGKTVVVTNTKGPLVSAMLDVIIPLADVYIRGVE